MTEKPLHEELRALAEYVDAQEGWHFIRDSLLALADRAKREQSPEREEFVEAACKVSDHVGDAFTAGTSREGAGEGDLLIFAMLDAYRAMLAAEEKRKEGV